MQVGGVGLRVAAPASTLTQIGATGDTATLHTYLHVREDVLALYGFATEAERHFFEMLLSVNGVGPRHALGILSALAVDQIRDAIGRGNADLLTVVPGVGKRLASRIVLDLKDKVGARAVPSANGVPAVGGDNEVIEALTEVFGYSLHQAAQAVSALGPEAPRDLEARIRAALAHFAPR